MKRIKWLGFAGLFMIILASQAQGLRRNKPVSETAAPNAGTPSGAAVLSGPVVRMRIQGIIDNAVEDYISKGIDRAESLKSAAVVITMDTPGGMLDATKKMVQRFLASEVPVVVYVSPKGASATSAGMMITIGANLAVMAPGTNIGASHPVMMPFMVNYQPIPENDVMMKKATQDTVGWVRSVCELRGRNADWAEKAVRESSSITANEAFKLKVIDGIADNPEELLKWLDGKTVKLNKERSVLIKISGQQEELKMEVGQTLQHIINNPNVILILILLGALGIAIELKAPGMIFPGLIGAACILVALLAPSLSINYIGLILIVVGLGLLVAELKIVSHGLLTVAGLVFLTYGALMLFQTERSWNVRVSWSILLPLIIFVAAVILIAGQRILAAHRGKVETGQEGLVGSEGEAVSDLNPSGKVFVNGEWWDAESLEGQIKRGEKIVVEKMDKFVLKVKKAH
jgi:membrane-bound serine protease (ClpP class)